MDYPQRHVEQFEVIERSVVESRKPISAEQALNYHPITQTQTSTEHYTYTDPINSASHLEASNSRFEPLSFAPNDANDKISDRYYLTGEREKDTSVLYNSSQSPPLVDRSFGDAEDIVRHRSYSSGINNYGYDLHEVQTSSGGARIVQTHGSGNVFSPENRSIADYDAAGGQPLNDSSFIVHDRSLDASTVLQSAGNSRSQLPPGYRETISREIETRHTVTNGSPKFTDASGLPYMMTTAAATADSSHTADQLHSILKSSEKKYPSSEDNSLSRKDSYRRMQEGQDSTNLVFAPSSSSSYTMGGSPAGKAPLRQWTFAQGSRHQRQTAGSSTTRSDVFDGVKTFCSQMRQMFRDTDWTPRLVGSLILIGLLVFLLLLICWLIFSSFFSSYAQRNFLLYPPVCEECLKRNPSAISYKAPSQLFVHLSSPIQAHFELIGNPPFKSNSFTAVDFYTGYVAIADHALTDENGRHTTCFLMELDRSALPDMSTLIDALDNTYHEVRTQFGWQEYWQYNAEPVDERYAKEKFRDDIDDCKNAKWYLLKHTVYTKDSSCSTCYDFCLPDYAVLRRQKYEDEPSLGVRRLNCFRHYVPEWSRYRVETDENGGHWLYPKQQLRQFQQQQRDNDWQQQQQQFGTTSRQQRERGANDQREQYHLVGSWVDAGSG